MMVVNRTTAWAPMRTRVTAGMGFLAIVLSSVAPAALAQESASRIDELRALANAARANAAAAEEKTRQQLASLNQRLEATAAQNELLLQMMGQMMTTQAGADIGEQLQAELDEVAAQTTQLAEAAEELLDQAESEAEQALADATKAFEDVLGQVPTTKEELAAWSKEEIERINAEVEKVKAAADEALDRYVEEDLIPQIRQSCGGSTAYEQRQLVTQARNGGNFEETLQQIGCTGAEDLVRKLSQARTAEETQDAFQSAMQSMMMAAMMSGNPYVAAIAAVLMLLASLFADGNGDGDGDGVDDQPGGGPVEGAPAPGNAQAADGAPTPRPTPEPPIEGPVDEPVTPVIDEPIDNRSDAEIRAAGGDPRVQSHPGVGCEYRMFVGPESLTLTDPSDPNTFFDIVLTDVQGTGPYANFPTEWIDERLRLISCNFNTEAVIIQYEATTPGDALCLQIVRDESDGAAAFRLTDTGFVIGENRLCSGG